MISVCLDFQISAYLVFLEILEFQKFGNPKLLNSCIFVDRHVCQYMHVYIYIYIYIYLCVCVTGGAEVH